MRTIVFMLALCLLQAGGTTAQPPKTDSAKLNWFRNAKLGIFIHWGIYSVNGVDESWSFYNKKISYADYMAQLKGFTAAAYNPEQWANLVQKSGARYSVITTRHHDGVALYNSKVSTMDVVDATPAKRDVIAPFFSALRKRNIKCGAYYSLSDWSHPDYPAFIRDSSRYNSELDVPRWNRYKKYCHAQITEVMDEFRPDLVWFDGDWEHKAEEWDAPGIRKLILDKNPRAIINGRLTGYGDYATPEQNFPVSRPAAYSWELCMTTNMNWGYHPDDTDYKTPYEVISIFTDVVSNGGNLLLDIGPREDGLIPKEQVNILTELGKWNSKHGEAIFNTIPGLPLGHYYGASTLSTDSLTLYLFVPAGNNGKLMIKGLNNKIESISVLGNNTAVGHKVVGKISWSQVPGLVYINPVPARVSDKYMTVLKLRLNNPLSLYRSEGGL
ncbi:MAG: alpha-L-fucosidase [Dinghuibacter sp.]|nr:alpha-L-fucosidase [Dinghuibacter sp.]